MLVLKAGVVYFLLTFAAGFAFGTVRVIVFEPEFGIVIAVLMEAPILIFAMAYFCRRVCSWFHLPAIVKLRAQMGAFAFILLIAAELTGAFIMKDMSPHEYFQNMAHPEGGIAFLLFVLFGIMPLFCIRQNISSRPQQQ